MPIPKTAISAATVACAVLVAGCSTSVGTAGFTCPVTCPDGYDPSSPDCGLGGGRVHADEVRPPVRRI